MRRKSKELNIGGVLIGGEHPVAIQSMCNIPSYDVENTIKQIDRLYDAGCQITRLAVPDEEGAINFAKIRKASKLPIVADIHFDYRLAIMAAEGGADKIRINPGNIGDINKVREVVAACKERGLPIRIGVNGGSLEKPILEKYGVTPVGLVESAMRHVDILEKCNFTDICISIKTSNVKNNIDAYRMMAEKCEYPLHLGVTEAGTEYMGTIKSAVALGSLLCDGIGDTIRVSLTDDPVKEIYAAKAILKSIGMTDSGVNIVSCPTCGRTRVGLIDLAKEVEQKLSNVKAKLNVAVMGCVVNGPGEAREADVGVACGKGEGLIFAKGEIIKKVPEDQIVPELIKYIEDLTGEKI